MSGNNVLAPSVTNEFEFFVPRSEKRRNDFSQNIIMHRKCRVDICKNNVSSSVKRVRTEPKDAEQLCRTFELDIRPAKRLQSQNVVRTVEIDMEHHDKLRMNLIDRIENIFLSLTEQLRLGELPKISYKLTSIETLMTQLEPNDQNSNENDESPASSSLLNDSFIDEAINDDSGFQNDFESPEIPERQSTSRRVVDFAQSRSQNQYSLILTTLAKFHELLVKNQTQQRRAFFYDLRRCEETIKQQSQVDKIVRAVANILDCPPWAMPLVASAKGFCAGNLKITLRNREIIECNGSEGVSISPSISSMISLTTSASFVLVVEKDTVFDILLRENCPRSLNCIMITGKGYPDMATRMLVMKLADQVQLPVYVLVDSDPHGVEIMLTYKFGSVNYSYEQGNFACTSARWLGLLPSELECHKIHTTPLEQIESTKLNSIKRRPYITDGIRNELGILQEQGKAGIEAMIGAAKDCDCDFTTFYIQRKIERSNYLN